MEVVLIVVVFFNSCVSPAGIKSQSVEMDDGKWGFVGTKVDLRCRFINSSPPVKISQVFNSDPANHAKVFMQTET